jgi:thiopeptide-type bacteriocin biosynthesis protein
MKLTFHPELIARTPSFPLEDLFDTSLDEILINPQFREAVYIASPELAKQIFDNPLNLSNELRPVVWKYFNRMCFRCTPYGMFAGCGKVKWADKTLVFRNEYRLRRRTRLDKEYFAALVKQLEIEKNIFFKLKLSLNNTLYEVGEQVRMIEPSIDQKDYQITGFPLNALMEVLLSAYGDKSFYVQEIINSGTALGFTVKGIKAYLLLLFEDGIIKTELDVLLPGKELLTHYIKTLTALKLSKHTKNWLPMLREIQNQLTSIDESENPGFEKYEPLICDLRSLLPEHPAKRILQVDQTHAPQKGELDSRLQKSLLKAVEILGKISTSPKSNDNLNNFKKAFAARYESREVPLLVAIDPEIGIGYTQQRIFDSFLLNQLAYHHVAESNHSVKVQYPEHQGLIIAFHASVANQCHELKLENIDLDIFKGTAKLPATSSIFFSQISYDQLLVKSVSGSSGMNLFSRFTDFDADLSILATQIARIDQESTDAVLAEIIHEPFLRSGNILPKTDFRSYQIPYVSQGANDDPIQIQLSDIVVGVDRGRVYLRSKKLDRLIRPMISHAFNYQKSSPLYRFFADLQFQDKDNIHFDFPSLIPGQPFYPRLTYQNLIFSAATWFIKWNDVPIDDKDGDDHCIRRFLNSKKVPLQFLICEGDNELLIDQRHPELLLIMIDMLKKRKQLTIKEFIHQPDFRGFHNGENKIYNNELIAVLINHDHIQTSPLLTPPFGLLAGMQRVFSFGSEWLYYKLYGGEFNLDQLLVQELFPLLKKLQSKKLIQDFFFIRYYDPEFHIRLRLKMSHNINLTEVTIALQECFKQLEGSGQIWKIQIDTYIRELERYGNSIAETESIFCSDSHAVLQLLQSAAIKDNPEQRIAVGIRMTADFLQLMNKDLDEAIVFSKRMRDSLKEDRNIGYPIEKRVRSLFEKDDLYGCYLKPLTDKKIDGILKVRMNKVKRQLEVLNSRFPKNYTEERGKLLMPYVHMNINRLFTSDQKFYEYLIYNYLFRHFNKIKNSPQIKKRSAFDLNTILEPEAVS